MPAPPGAPAQPQGAEASTPTAALYLAASQVFTAAAQMALTLDPDRAAAPCPDQVAAAAEALTCRLHEASRLLQEATRAAREGDPAARGPCHDAVEMLDAARGAALGIVRQAQPLLLSPRHGRC